MLVEVGGGWWVECTRDVSGGGWGGGGGWSVQGTLVEVDGEEVVVHTLKSYRGGAQWGGWWWEAQLQYSA